MPAAATIAADHEDDFHDACCIEPTQGGVIRSTDTVELVVLPVPLREEASKGIGNQEYGNLWPRLRKYTQQNDAGNQGNLSSFYKRHEKDLDSFIAQFEPVPNQVGALFLVNDQVVGIERVPNYQFWNEMWRPLVRGSYGAYAYQKAKQDPTPSKLRRSLLVDCTGHDLDSLQEAVDKVNEKLLKMTQEIVEHDLLEKEFESKTLSDNTRSSELMVVGLSNDQFLGQVVIYKNNPVYFSLVVKDYWATTRKQWKHQGAPFSF